MNKILPRFVTSYDLLKTFAVIVMLADHWQAFNFNTTTEFRVMTHLTLPIWFFLIGYARSRDLNIWLWVAAVLIIVADVIAGMIIFPLNMLVTILCVRIAIDTCMKTLPGKVWAFWLLNIFFLVLAPFTMLLTEYGTLGMIIATFGYLIRHYNNDPHKRATLVFPHLLFTIASFALVMWAWFLPDGIWVIVLFAGSVLVMLGLSNFRPMEFPRLTRLMTPPVVWLVQFMGRHTLFIYAAHFIILKLISPWVHPDKFQFMNWTFFPPYVERL